ncbi:NAD(P)-dependent oxidoreductase [Sphingomonas sp. BT-65]|uniref:NAD-dependent epimerase/dehydratase family protein n=1 Tax=Sphingomonas sp. BT-65 TaxID=2989821 RepID=UPI00223698C8|nr:NAD(P)-dependent oxidoreductase [Sphingomonas sp. BT-65]MCW4463433.1 NAD(P)-dependent oxidoreductase [Sphingomonas sp. BT-65]
MPERVLITGGAGFIGSHLAASHLDCGDEVHLIVRPAGAAHTGRIRPGAIVHAVDLKDLPQVRECFGRANPTIFYHLASATGRDPGIPDPAEWPVMTRDLDQLLIVLAAAAESPDLRIMIRAGSLAEYGNQPTPSPETRRELPRTVYTAAMAAGALYCAMVQPRLAFPVLTARLGLTYGPGQSEDFLLPALLRRCLSGETMVIRQPDDRRDMVYIDDIVAGLRAMARSNLPGGTIINLSSGQAPKVREIVELVLRVTGTPADRVRMEAGERSNLRIDTVCGVPDLAALVLGWRARTSLEEGIALTSRSLVEVIA